MRPPRRIDRPPAATQHSGTDALHVLVRLLARQAARELLDAPPQAEPPTADTP